MIQKEKAPGQFSVLALLCFVFIIFNGCSTDEEPPRVETGRFYIFSQSELDELDGVQSIIGSLRLQFPLSGEVEDPIVDLSPLSQLTSVTEVVLIDNIDTIDTFEPLSNIRYIGGGLAIAHNDNITSLNAFRSLKQAGTTLYIQDNDRLKNLDGLQNIEFYRMFYFQIALNDSLTSLFGLEGFSELSMNPSGRLHIHRNDQLASLQGLESLRSVQEISIKDNLVLSDISALEKVENVSLLEISSCPNLIELCRFDHLDSCREVTIREIPATNFEVFGGVKIERIILSGLSLSSLDWLNSYEWLDYLSISEMNNLINLTGLGDLGRVENLKITENSALSDLTGIGSLSFVGYLIISGNTGICESAIQEWVDSIEVETVVVVDNGSC